MVASASWVDYLAVGFFCLAILLLWVVVEKS